MLDFIRTLAEMQVFKDADLESTIALEFQWFSYAITSTAHSPSPCVREEEINKDRSSKTNDNYSSPSGWPGLLRTLVYEEPFIFIMFVLSKKRG